jgi:hypothetical protein
LAARFVEAANGGGAPDDESDDNTIDGGTGYGRRQ